MNKLTFDKSAAAVFSAVLLLLVANAFVDLIYPTGRNVPRQGAQMETPSPESSAIALLASADPDKGEKLAKKCEICHSLKEGGGSKVGPELYGVVGRKVASVPGFAYSKALKSKGGEWTYEKLDAWIESPHEDNPQSKMTFTGMFTAQDRANLLAFLRTLSDAPVPLPGANASPPAVPAAPSSDTHKPTAPAPGPTGAIEPQTTEPPSDRQEAAAPPPMDEVPPMEAEPGKADIIIARQGALQFA